MRAKQVLDDAGWKLGADGVRPRTATASLSRSSTYPGRADLTPYAVSMQSQLKPLGFALQVKEVQNIGDATKDGNFDAAMKSNNTLPTGNPLYEYNRLIGKGGGDNSGTTSTRRSKPACPDAPGTRPGEATALSRQVQEIIKADVPVIFLTVSPITPHTGRGRSKATAPSERLVPHHERSFGELAEGRPG